MFKYARKNTLINGLTTIFNYISLWNSAIWHNDVFYIHIIIYLKLQLLPATSASCQVTQRRGSVRGAGLCNGNRDDKLTTD